MIILLAMFAVFQPAGMVLFSVTCVSLFVIFFFRNIA